MNKNAGQGQALGGTAVVGSKQMMSRIQGEAGPPTEQTQSGIGNPENSAVIRHDATFPLTKLGFTLGTEYSAEQAANLQKIAAAFPHWLVSDGPGKRPKAPQLLNGRNAGWDDPSNSATLDQALNAVKCGRAGCVGLLSHSGAPGFVVLDFDKVVAGGVLAEVGAQVIEHFRTAYVEFSPSMTGLRVVCRGAVSPGVFKGFAKARSGDHSFEIYAAGGSKRFVRMTGAAVEGTGGAMIAECQTGIDWALTCIRSNRPDKSCAAASRDSSDAVSEWGDRNHPEQTGGDVFAQLADLRPVLKPAEVLASLKQHAGQKPRSKLAEALRLNLKPWSGDHSAADFFIVSEALRRGAGSAADAIEVWGGTALAQRDKFKHRADYRDRTANDAAASVLSGLVKDPAKAGPGSRRTVTLPAEFTAALALSGDALSLSSRGAPLPTAGNVFVIMRNHPDCVGKVGFNELRLDNERLGSWRVFDRDASDEPGPLETDDLTRIGHWLTRTFGSSMDVKRSILRDGVSAAARGASFNPLQDRLKALGESWDGVKRLSGWMQRYALVDDAGCAEYVQAVSRCFLIGAVARAMKPGMKADASLVLEGKGGAGKSTLFRMLAEAVLPDTFTDAVHDITDPVNLVESTKGKWIVELSELAATRRGDVESLKKAMTLQFDSYRAPYAEKSENIGRRFVFVCTTNRTEYLADEGDGGTVRRFWPLRTRATEGQRMPLDEFAAVATQIVGEAVRCWSAGERWWIVEADGEAYRQWLAQRAERREAGPFYDELLPVLLTWSGEYGGPQDAKSLKEIAKLCGDHASVEGDQRAIRALTGTLRGLGLERHKSRTGSRLWRFTREALLDFTRRREQAFRERVAEELC